MGRPIVPLSRKKTKSLSPYPFVLGQGQEQKSQDKLLCLGRSRDKIITSLAKKEVKNCQKKCLSKVVIFSLIFLLSHGTGQTLKILARPGARFWACPVVLLSRDNEGTSVPLSQKVALFCPVGNIKRAFLHRHNPCSTVKVLKKNTYVQWTENGIWRWGCQAFAHQSTKS